MLAGLAAAARAASRAGAQGFPSRTITIVVPYPPGGPIDTLARLIAQEAAADLKQPIVVENRPGASGIVGTGAVARAEPDGHTLILGTNQTHATNQSLIKNWTFDAVKDFAPVAGVAAMPHVLVVRKDFAAKSVGDVVAMAKAKPGALTFGSMGNGSGAHLAGELFKTKAGIDMLHVPYKGLSPMTTELLAGRVDLSIAPLPGLIAQQIASGNVRALGIASARRDAAACCGADLCRSRRRRRRGRRLVGAVCAGEDPACGDRAALSRGGRGDGQGNGAGPTLARQGLPVALKTPAEMSAMLPGEVEKWAAVIKLANVTVE